MSSKQNFCISLCELLQLPFLACLNFIAPLYVLTCLNSQAPANLTAFASFCSLSGEAEGSCDLAFYFHPKPLLPARTLCILIHLQVSCSLFKAF